MLELPASGTLESEASVLIDSLNVNSRELEIYHDQTFPILTV